MNKEQMKNWKLIEAFMKVDASCVSICTRNQKGDFLLSYNFIVLDILIL